jgi:GNAT superfamily N-acetyltransferase
MALEKGKTQALPLWWREETRLLMERGAYRGVIVRVGGEAVGFADAILAFEPADAEWLLLGRTLFVLPAHRGAALGEALMVHLLALGRQAGATAVVTHGEPSKRAMARLGLPTEEAARYTRARI